MKRNLLSMLFAVVLWTGISLSASAEVTREERKVKSFEGVSISLSADVELRQGSETRVILEGPADFLKKVETVTEGGILKIRFYSRYSSWRTPKGRIRIFITSPVLHSLVVTGSANVKTVTPLKVDDVLKALVTGSGKIVIGDLKAGEVKLGVTGSGDIRVGGTYEAEKGYVSITGSGDVYADKLPVKNIKVGITGSGDAHVYATEMLKVSITGSGDVHYKGPAVIDAHITGSGNVRKDD